MSLAVRRYSEALLDIAFEEKCEDEVYEIECPACNDVIYLDADMLAEEGMVCPNCGTDLEFDFDLDCDCDCGCDCCKEEEE